MTHDDYMWQVYGILPEPDPIYGHGYTGNHDAPEAEHQAPPCNWQKYEPLVPMEDLNDDIPF